MLKKLRTVVYHAGDLPAAKAWYSDMFGIAPYFDEAFYVGFDVNGCELGLDPDAAGYSEGQHSIAYWQVDDLQKTFATLAAKNADVHQAITPVGEGIFVASIKDPFGNVIGLIEVPG